MRLCSDLGRAVESRWRSVGRKLDRLPSIAAAALRDVDADRIAPVALAEQAAIDPRSPRQLPRDFGDAQVTLWRSEHVLVQLIYWLDETTAIHQHGFAGAFRVMTGASLHSIYRFHPRTRGAAFRIGRLDRLGQELLAPGDVREIGPGPALIHNLVHVESPSVTLTVRTPFLATLSPQWLYHPPGVAIDPDASDPDHRVRLRLLAAVSRIDRDRAVRIGRALIATGPAASWDVLVTIATVERDPAALAPYAAAVRRRHGTTGRLLIEAITTLQARSRLFALRRVVRSRPHRTFLALLGDAGDRATIDTAIARLYPGAPPGARLETWIRDLRGALGLSIDRGAARIFRRTVEGATPAAVARELAATRIGGYPVATVRAVAAAFRQSPLFAPLFR